MSFPKTILLCVAVATTMAGTATDLELTMVHNHPFVVAPATIKLVISGGNITPGTVNGYVLHYTDGADTYSDTSSTSVDYLYPFGGELSHPFTVGPGETKYFTIWVEAVGDPNPANDTIHYALHGLTFLPDKVVLVEEGQGTWCNWCPRGYVVLDSMDERYGDTIATVGIHWSASSIEPMAFDEYAWWMVSTGRFSGIPGATIDRTHNKVPTNYYDDRIDEQKVLPPPASVSVSSSVNWTTSEIEIDIEVEMAAELTGDYRVNAIVVEHGVTGPSPDYDQRNSYAGGANGPMGIYSSLPDPVPAGQMVYDRVARALGGGPEGDSASLPPFLGVNSSHTYQYIVSLESVGNSHNVEVIAILLDGTTGEVLNAGKGSLNTGIDLTIGPQIRLFPNPARDLAFVDVYLVRPATVSMTVFDMAGKVVDDRTYGTLNGQQLLPIRTEAYPSGLYVASLRVGDVVQALRLAVE